MASNPSYDPSEFVPRISTADYARLRNDPRKPLFNRAYQGAFSPGSIIKPLIGISLLENGSLPTETVYCDGYTKVGGHPIRCWIKADGHGEVTLNDAIAVSCNDYFIESGLKLGLERLAATYKSAGIGSKTGFVLPETPGRLPSRAHKRRWTAFDTALISIGQGDVLVSPLQAALYTAAIANGGTLWKPNILKSILAADGSTVYSEQPEANGRIAASPQTLEMIRYGMFLSVNSDVGGSRRAHNEAIQLSGKTGTAEVGPPGSSASEHTAAKPMRSRFWWNAESPAAEPAHRSPRNSSPAGSEPANNAEWNPYSEIRHQGAQYTSPHSK